MLLPAVLTAVGLVLSPRSACRAPSCRMVAAAPTVPALAADEKWIGRLDLDAFGDDVKALGRRLRAGEGEADLAHLRKMRRWNLACAIVGVGTMALPLNPISVVCLSTWTFASWTMLAHHTCHGGYNKHRVGGLSSSRFALGSITARVRDWLDWMLPEAWNVEHNTLHHYSLGEDRDPDLVERNLEFVRRWRGPHAAKLALVAVLAGVWKWAYYAPNTYKQYQQARYLQQHHAMPPGVDPHKALTLSGVITRPHEFRGMFRRRDFVRDCLLPVVALRFLLLPAPLLLLPGGLGRVCFSRAVLHLLLADVLSNYHSFLTIVTNHAGDDLYRFSTGCTPNSPTFMLRQVLSSANYRTGSDRNDFLHGFLNYQVSPHPANPPPTSRLSGRTIRNAHGPLTSAAPSRLLSARRLSGGASRLADALHALLSACAARASRHLRAARRPLCAAIRLPAAVADGAHYDWRQQHESVARASRRGRAAQGLAHRVSGVGEIETAAATLLPEHRAVPESDARWQMHRSLTRNPQAIPCRPALFLKMCCDTKFCTRYKYIITETVPRRKPYA